MSIFSFLFGEKKKFNRNYYGELCEVTREKCSLEDTNELLRKENAELRARLRVFDPSVEPETQIEDNLPKSSDFWLTIKPRKEGAEAPMVIEDPPEPVKEEDDFPYDIKYDVEILPDGTEHRIDEQTEQTRPAVTPLMGRPGNNLKAGLS